MCKPVNVYLVSVINTMRKTVDKEVVTKMSLQSYGEMFANASWRLLRPKGTMWTLHFLCLAKRQEL